jgi:hypothetical protein
MSQLEVFRKENRDLSALLTANIYHSNIDGLYMKSDMSSSQRWQNQSSSFNPKPRFEKKEEIPYVKIDRPTVDPRSNNIIFSLNSNNILPAFSSGNILPSLTLKEDHPTSQETYAVKGINIEKVQITPQVQATNIELEALLDNLYVNNLEKLSTSRATKFDTKRGTVDQYDTPTVKQILQTIYNLEGGNKKVPTAYKKLETVLEIYIKIEESRKRRGLKDYKDLSAIIKNVV